MRSWRNGRAFWVAAGLCILAGLGCMHGRAAADDAKDAVESAVGSDRIQREAPLPDEMRKSVEEADATEADKKRKSVEEAESQPDIQRDAPTPKPLDIPIPRFSFNLGWLPYVILAVIGIGLLVLIVRYVRFRSTLADADRDRPPAKGTTSYGIEVGDDAERDHTFDEVDALAAQGAFAEAIHRLLLLVQEQLRSRIEHGLQTSLTSREILRRADLPGEAKTAFGSLVAAVEITLFGRQAADLATYQRCRESSRRVLAAAV